MTPYNSGCQVSSLKNVNVSCFLFKETQKLWALDLSLHYSDSLAMYQLMQYVSNGALDTTTHEFNVPAPKQDTTKRRRRRLAGEKEEVNSRFIPYF